MTKFKLNDLKLGLCIFGLIIGTIKGTSLYNNYLANTINVLITVSIFSFGLIYQMKILKYNKQNKKVLKDTILSLALLWVLLLGLYNLFIAIW